MKKILILITATFLFVGCTTNNSNVLVQKTGVITKVDDKKMTIVLNNGMKIQLATVTGDEAVGDVIKLELR